MRLALISDIHGNDHALQAVLHHIQQAQVTQTICLGDIATLGPQPRQAVDRLMQHNIPCIMGNHDAFLLDPDLASSYMDVPWFRNNIAWCINQLDHHHLDYVRQFPPRLTIPLDANNRLCCFHGSPDSPFTNILATTDPDELQKLLQGHEATIMAGGHTHVQMLRQHRGIWLLNVGSVGMPFEQLPFANAPRLLPWAEYSIVQANNGTLSVTMQRVPLDVAQLQTIAYQSGMPHPEEWADNWLPQWKPRA